MKFGLSLIPASHSLTAPIIDFANKFIHDSNLVNLVKANYEVIPEELKKTIIPRILEIIKQQITVIPNGTKFLELFMAVIIGLWPCALTTKLSYTHLFK